MAEMTTPADAPTATSACCSPQAQANCCEPSEKSSCCGEAAAGGSCGCSAGQSPEPASVPAAEGGDIRETVRETYAAAARAVAAQSASASCCGPVALADAGQREVFGASLYGDRETDGATAGAVGASLGCGVPTAVADLREGETVLDLGSGAGADVLISARRVGATGRAIGLDMTDEMLELARANAAEAGVTNVEFVKGYIEDMPLADASVDVVISNCVINLAGDKHKVLAEAARVLKPGGRFAVSDVIADADMDHATRADMAAYTGCIAGALTAPEFREALTAAGLTDIEIRETHRVHEQAASAIVRARKPVPTPTPDAPAAAARRVDLYEPAMCCQTGVCGPSGIDGDIAGLGRRLA
jgi:arsenite methyltransferase